MTRWTIHISLVGGIIPVARFSAAHQSAMNFTSATVANLTAISKACGYEAALDKVTYPPKGKIPLPYKGLDEVQEGCELDEVWYNYGTFPKREHLRMSYQLLKYSGF